MKQLLKALPLAAAVLVSGLAHATPITVVSGGTASDKGWEVYDPVGSGTVNFSATLLGALNAGGVQVTGVAPAVVRSTTNARGGYTSVAIDGPVYSGTGEFDGQTLTILGIGSKGGATLTATADGFTNTGGSLTLQNLDFDVANKKVYADIDGANGVGHKDHFLLWNVATIEGPTAFAAVEGTTTSNNALRGLTIDQNAFEVFSQAVGLTAVGRGALQTVTDYGYVTSTISLTARKLPVASVPEPSTYLMMGVGLVGVGLMTRRKAAAKA